MNGSWLPNHRQFISRSGSKDITFHHYGSLHLLFLGFLFGLFVSAPIGSRSCVSLLGRQLLAHVMFMSATSLQAAVFIGTLLSKFCLSNIAGHQRHQDLFHCCCTCTLIIPRNVSFSCSHSDNGP